MRWGSNGGGVCRDMMHLHNWPGTCGIIVDGPLPPCMIGGELYVEGPLPLDMPSGTV